MSDARQADKFSGRAGRTPENTDFGTLVSLDIDRQCQNQLLAGKNEHCTAAVFIEASASREDVQEVLEDLAAEAEYLGGGGS